MATNKAATKAAAKAVATQASLAIFKDAGRECEQAEFGYTNATHRAAAFYCDELLLSAGSTLAFKDWQAVTEPFEKGYFESYIERWKDGVNRKPDDETIKRGHDAARKAISRVRQIMVELGVVFEKSQSTAATKKDAQREVRKAQDAEIVQTLRARAQSEGIDIQQAALEVGQGNAGKTAKLLGALERVETMERRAAESKNSAEIAELRKELRDKIKSADLATLRAMLAA
jgi:hypothetical protein